MEVLSFLKVPDSAKDIVRSITEVERVSFQNRVDFFNKVESECKYKYRLDNNPLSDKHMIIEMDRLFDAQERAQAKLAFFDIENYLQIINECISEYLMLDKSYVRSLDICIKPYKNSKDAIALVKKYPVFSEKKDVQDRFLVSFWSLKEIRNDIIHEYCKFQGKKYLYIYKLLVEFSRLRKGKNFRECIIRMLDIQNFKDPSALLLSSAFQSGADRNSI